MVWNASENPDLCRIIFCMFFVCFHPCSKNTGQCTQIFYSFEFFYWKLSCPSFRYCDNKMEILEIYMQFFLWNLSNSRLQFLNYIFKLEMNHRIYPKHKICESMEILLKIFKKMIILYKNGKSGFGLFGIKIQNYTSTPSRIMSNFPAHVVLCLFTVSAILLSIQRGIGNT